MLEYGTDIDMSQDYKEMESKKSINHDKRIFPICYEAAR